MTGNAPCEKWLCRPLGLVALLATTSVAPPYHFVRTASGQSDHSRFSEVCVIMDREASAGVALLVLDPAVAIQRIDEAIKLLRRARMYCGRRWIDFARVDYSALRGASSADERLVQTPCAISQSIAAVDASSQR